MPQSCTDAVRKHWPQIFTVAAGILMLFWAYGCQPKTKSLTGTGQQVTRAELQTELNNLIDKFNDRNADLDRQEELRRMITANALAIAQTGQFDPLGFLTMLAGTYGVGSAVNDARRKAKTKATTTTPRTPPSGPPVTA